MELQGGLLCAGARKRKRKRKSKSAPACLCARFPAVGFPERGLHHHPARIARSITEPSDGVSRSLWASRVASLSALFLFGFNELCLSRIDKLGRVEQLKRCCCCCRRSCSSRWTTVSGDKRAAARLKWARFFLGSLGALCC